MRSLRPALSIVWLMAGVVLTRGAWAWQSSSGQPSLAEVAEKDKERRAKEKKPAKSFTDADLKKTGRGNFNAMEGSGAAPAPADAQANPQASPGATKEKSADEQRAEREKAWRERLQKTQEDVTRLMAQVNRLQQMANDPMVDQYGVAHAETLKQLDLARQQLAAAQQSVEGLQEEGRRNAWR